jgi:hypothetical protein
MVFGYCLPDNSFWLAGFRQQLPVRSSQSAAPRLPPVARLATPDDRRYVFFFRQPISHGIINGDADV